MRRTHVVAEDCGSPIRTQEYQEADVPILGEVLFAAELILLHAAPLYYGLGIPHGDGAAVILIPAFPLPEYLFDPDASMAGENWIRSLLFRHRFQHPVPEPPDQTATECDH